jgi:hypothetical protein
VNEHDADRTPVPPALIPADDDALLRELGDVINRLDPVPAHLLGAARAAFGLRRLDDELARLAYDSAEHEPELALRSDDGPRLLTFETPDLRVELQVEDRHGAYRLFGRLEPPGPGHVELEDRDGQTRARVEVDDTGRFGVERVPGGAVRLTVHRAGTPSTTTEWTVLA